MSEETKRDDLMAMAYLRGVQQGAQWAATQTVPSESELRVAANNAVRDVLKDASGQP